MIKSDGIVSDKELENFIRLLRKPSFSRRCVTRCYPKFIKTECYQSGEGGEKPPKIYGANVLVEYRISIQWSEQEIETLKEGVDRLGKDN